MCVCVCHRRTATTSRPSYGTAPGSDLNVGKGMQIQVVSYNVMKYIVYYNIYVMRQVYGIIITIIPHCAASENLPNIHGG